jgi:hypothetical protein
MKWAGHVAIMRKMRNECKLLVGKPEGKNHSKDLSVDGKIILEWISGKQGGKLWTGSI